MLSNISLFLVCEFLEVWKGSVPVHEIYSLAQEGDQRFPQSSGQGTGKTQPVYSTGEHYLLGD